MIDHGVRRRARAPSLLVALALAPLLRAQVPADAALRPTLERVDALVAAELEKHPVGGCAVGVVVGPELVWAKGYGLADIENEIPATAGHVFRIGSITKQFTGLMLLQLAERGTVRLSDPVERYLPEIAKVRDRHEGAPPITLVQLATMTSGLGREPDNLREHLRGPVSDWESVLLAALPDTRHQFEPDTRYHYSNIGYAILGVALARAAERPFVDYVSERILAPLGMADTAFEPNERIEERIAKGYALRRGEVDGSGPAREHAGRGYKVPNGAMYTTVADLAKFLSFELGHGPETVLAERAVDANFSRLNSANGDLTSGYGIGFMAKRSGDIVAFGHGGSVAGYNAAAWIDRESQTGVIVLRNVGGGRFRTGDLCQRALRLVAAARAGK